MSYQLDLDKGKKPEIAMPPLPEENNTPEVMVENQGEIGQDVVENVKDLSIRYRQKVKFSETLYIKNIWVAVTIPYKKPTTIILKL